MHSGRHPLRQIRTRARALRGFTLVELMIVIAVVAILLGLAVPSFYETITNMKLTSYANNLVGSTLLARSEAINRNAVVSMCVSPDGMTCGGGGWQQGWIVMCNTNAAPNNVVCDPAGTNVLVVHRQPAVSTGWNITEANGLTAIAFQPTGTSVNSAATLTICRATPSVGSNERLVRISTTGRPSVTKTANGVCP